MKIVCSWCRKEGKPEFVGEKAPLDDARETHGICVIHRDQIQARWCASVQVTADTQTGWKAESSSALFRWSGLLNLTRKMRP